MILKATRKDAEALAALAHLLWEGHSEQALEEEFRELLKSGEAACFLAWEAGSPVGFAQCQLRHDYVEGTKTSPVGYLEGIFVLPEFRHRGLARELLAACEGWAVARGCAEFASDCELCNEASRAFHLGIGFSEANRIICFTKKL